MITLGTLRDGGNNLLSVDPAKSLFHTAIVGQSGSGKSFALARILEEIILNTRVRIIILDPNGDFSRFHKPQNHDYWATGKMAGALSDISAKRKVAHSNFDSEADFCGAWNSKRFQLISADQRNWTPFRQGANAAPLRLHWKWLGWEQDVLLQVDAAQYPKLQLGIVACNHYCTDNRSEYPQGYSLEDLENVAHSFAARRIATAEYPHAISLSTDDWYAVALQFRQVRKRYPKLWFDGPLYRETTAPNDLSNYIYNGFHAPDPWQTCVVSLAGLDTDHMHLAANVALLQVWQRAIEVWRAAREFEFSKLTAQPVDEAKILDVTSADRNTSDPEMRSSAERPDLNPRVTGITEIDQRVPTIIVVDEAHNFAPLEPASELQRRVSDRIATIAAEGRKYGLFLYVATQRPQKLRKGLMAECENACLMRLQSKVEQEYAASELGIPKDTLTQLAQFDTGEGLVTGRWTPGYMACKFAPSRTVLGGGSIPDASWKLNM